MWRPLLTGFFLILLFGSSIAALGPGGLLLAAYLLVILSVIWLRRRGWKVEANLLLAVAIGLPVCVLFFASVAESAAALWLAPLILGLYLLGIVGTIRLWRAGRKPEATAASAVLITLTLIVLMLPAGSAAREAAVRSQCSNNLKQIALAMVNYEQKHGCFPPAYLCDKHGKPMHSWRVLLLPYVESDATYKKYNFNEPWNGPNNRLLAEYMPLGYVCPAAYKAGANRPPMTSYVVVTGANTAFPGCESRRLEEITDDKGETVILVEVANSDIHWMEPRDPSVDELAASPSGRSQAMASHHGGFGYWRSLQPSPGNVLCADGSVHFLRGPIELNDAKVILSVNGGEKLKIEEIKGRPPLVAGLRWDHAIGLPAFCLSFIALLVLAVTTPRRERQPAPEGSSPTVEAPP